MRKFLSFALVLFLMIAPAAFANSPPIINDTGAAQLKQDIEAALAFKGMPAKESEKGLHIGAPVSVTPKSSFYEVKIPNITLMSGKGMAMDIGTIVINAAPGKEGEWLISMALPSPLKAIENGKTVATLTIGKQRFSAAWMPEYGFTPKMDSQYDNIQIKGEGETPFLLKVSHLKNTMNLKQDAQGRFSGPTHFEMTGTEFFVTGKKASVLKIEKISGDGAYEGLDTRPRLALQKKIRDMLDTTKDKPLSQEEKEQLATDIQKVSQMFDTLRGAFDVSNLSLEIHENKKDGATEPLMIRLVRLGGKISGEKMRADKSDLLFQLGLEGLKVSKLPEDLKGLMPHSADILLSANSLPLGKLYEDAFEVLKETSRTENAEGEKRNQELSDRAKEIIGGFPALLASSGATVTIKKNLRTDNIQTAMDGRFTATDTPPLFVSGKMVLTLKGLEETIEKFIDVSKKAEADRQQKIFGYINALSLLKMTSKEDKDADGKPLRKYTFDIQPDGKMTLNDMPLDALRGMLAPQKSTPTPAKAPAPVKTAPETQKAP